MKSLGRADRFIHQVIGPFRPIAPTILQGIDLQYRQKMHPHLPAQCVLTILSHIFMNTLRIRLSEAEELQLARYRKVVSAIPGLDEQVQYTKDYHARELVHLAAFVSTRYHRLTPCSSFYKLEHASSKDHTEDLEMIRKHAERYTSVYGYTDIGGTKDDLSHHDITAARLLCPRRLRDQFGMDMEYFYDDIRNGDRPYSCSDWPSFLYPKTVYNPDAIKKGLMRGPFLFSVSLFG